MRVLLYLIALLMFGTAVAQNPTIIQGSYITNVFGNSNFVLNPNARTDTTNVVPVNATVTRSTTTPLVATSEFVVTTSTSTGTISWPLRVFDQGMKGQNCEARFSYRGFSVGSTTAQIVQGSNVVAQLTLTPSTDPRIASINFPCGDLSAATTFRLQQSVAQLTGTNEIGGIYVGLATNMANVAQAENVVQASRGTAQSFALNVETTIIFSTETKDAYNEFDTSNGRFTAKRAGDYLISTTWLSDNVVWTANSFLQSTIYKNTSPICRNYKRVEATITINLGISSTCVISLAVGDYLESKIIQNQSTINSIADGTYVFTSISRFPSSSELVVTPERQNTWAGVTYSRSSDTIAVGQGAVAPTGYSVYFDSLWNTGKTYHGKCEATDVNSDRIGCKIPNLPVGTYKMTATGLFYETVSTGTANVICSYALLETTTNNYFASTTNYFNNTAGGVIYNGRTLTGLFKNTAVGDRNFVLAGNKTSDSATNGACNIFVGNSGGDISNFTITIEPIDQPSNSALYVEGPVKASATGAAIPAGYVGEVKSATSGGFIAAGSSAAYKTFTSLSLEAGVWSCASAVTTLCNSLNCLDPVMGFAGTNNGNPGGVDGWQIGIWYQQTGWQYQSSGTIPLPVRSTGSSLVLADGTTTGSNILYSVARITYPSGSPLISGRTYCTRIN